MRFNKLAVFIFSILLFGVFMPVRSQERIITVTCQINSNNGYDFSYDKIVEGSYLVIVKLNNAENANETEFKEIVKSPHGFLFSLKPVIKNNPVRFSTYSTSYLRGIPNPKIDTSFVYALPYKKGNTFSAAYLTNLNQKYFGNISNLKYKAFEFNSKDCDTVCSIRKGIVINVVDKYEMDTTIGKSYTSHVNSILIEQPDGTFASYSGFKKGSIWVKEGQTVLPYTPLGTLAHYDSNKTYSLRLSVYFLADTKIDYDTDKPVTLKTSKNYYEHIDPWFLTDKGVQKLMNHKPYCSDFSEYVSEHEMDKKELKAIGKKSKAIDDLKRLKTKMEIEKDTTYFDKFGNVVSSLSKAFVYGWSWVDPGNKHKLLYQEFYPSGKLKGEGSYIDKADTLPAPRAFWTYTDRNTGKNWILHGRIKQWYENGQLQRDVEFRNGNVKGRKTTYWDNGKLKRTNVDSTGNRVVEKCFDRNGKEVPVYPYSKAVYYKQGQSSIEEYIKSEINYPEEAIAKAIEGNVEVEVNIDTDGSVADVKTIKSADPLLDKELKRVLLTMPKWTPSIVDGDTYATHRTLRHYFTLPQQEVDWTLKLEHQDTTFYNKFGRIVKGRKNARYYEILQNDPHQKDMVIEREYYSSGKIFSEKYFKKEKLTENLPDSIRKIYGNMVLSPAMINRFIRTPEGKYTEWYENGKVRREINYLSGKRNGQVLFYWEDGTPRRNDMFEDGVLVKGNCYDNKGRPVEYFDLDKKASFPGGKKAMIDFLSSNLNYPEKALKKKVEGTIEVRFQLDPTGLIVAAMVDKHIDNDLEYEALRLVHSMPAWHPEYKDGQPVSSIQTVKIKFVI